MGHLYHRAHPSFLNLVHALVVQKVSAQPLSSRNALGYQRPTFTYHAFLEKLSLKGPF